MLGNPIKYLNKILFRIKLKKDLSLCILKTEYIS